MQGFLITAKRQPRHVKCQNESKGQFKCRHWRQSENNTQTHTAPENVHPETKEMKETRLFHGLDKALPGKILNRSQKSSAEKCSCFFSEEKNGALKKRQNALLLQRWWCRISLRVYSANSVPRQRHGVLGNGLETSNRCPVRCIQALLCWPESKAWPRARLFFIF